MDPLPQLHDTIEIRPRLVNEEQDVLVWVPAVRTVGDLGGADEPDDPEPVAPVPEGSQRVMVTLAAETGLRVGELLGLKWSNADLEKRVVQLRQRIRSTEEDEPKSIRSKRDGPISSATGKRLAALKLSSLRSGDGDYVFASRERQPAAVAEHIPVVQASGRSRWCAVGGMALAPARRRHGGCWPAFPSQVSRLLGHADASFTLRVYISVLPTDLPDGDTLAKAVNVFA